MHSAANQRLIKSPNAWTLVLYKGQFMIKYEYITIAPAMIIKTAILIMMAVINRTMIMIAIMMIIIMIMRIMSIDQ